MPSLRIVPINRVDRETLMRLGHCLEERFLLEAQCENAVAIPENALNRERDQLFFPTLVARVQGARVGGGDGTILAVTRYDLFKTQQRFVFAGASGDGRVAAVSLRRLAPDQQAADDPNLVFQRLLKIATHAIGRASGLNPCHNDRCAMAVASTVYDLDAADSYLCDACERKKRSRR